MRSAKFLKQEKTVIIDGFFLFLLVAGVGFEPHDLRVMSGLEHSFVDDLYGLMITFINRENIKKALKCVFFASNPTVLVFFECFKVLLVILSIL